MDRLKLGSLFDGSGGFPLGGLLCGIEPVWASEIEPFPIRVTTKRLPQMKHLGDVCAVSGAEIEPVDIVTFGSPCTDMSIAGRRAGLEGRQSSLFYQAIRIIKEMRCATNGKYPRYIVWENVPGAFSSSKGEDFRAVLEAVCAIKDGDISLPGPPKGKWTNAGNIVADSFSIAWRVLDARFWGVPQRRKRIYLVADFAGAGAGKILFESEGVSGYSAESFRAWQRAAGAASDCTGTAGSICLNDQGGSQMNISEGIAGTLRAQMDGHPPCIVEPAAPVYIITPCTFTQIVEEQAPTLTARDFKGPPAVNRGCAVRRLTPSECARLQGFPDWWCAGLETELPSDADIAFWSEVWETHRKVIGTSSRPKSRNQIIKWLQHPYSDAAEYKLWGNGIALPNVFFVLAGVVWSTQMDAG